MRRLRWLGLALVLGCGSGGGAVDVPPDSPLDAGADARPVQADAAPDAARPDVGPPAATGCNPLAPEADCLLPYPSDFFLVADPRMPSGHRLAVPLPALPKGKDATPVDPTGFFPADGFSHHPLILAFFPQGVDPSNLVFHTPDATASLSPQSPTVILEADTGRPVLHFAELDALPEAEGRRALQIRPLVRLRNGARYIVAIHGLRAPDGSTLPAPDGFRRLRDHAPATGPLAALGERYERDVFPALAAFGLRRADLQLAWDFTVESEERVTGDMLAIRADAMARLAATPPAVTIDAVEEGPFTGDLPADFADHVARRVRGKIRVPLYTESPAPVAPLHRDGSGRPAYNGDAEAEFTLLIPVSAADAAAAGHPARVLQFGHGFFGTRSEIETGFAYAMADRLGLVIVAMDWWGMSAPDSPLVAAAAANHPEDVARFTDRVHQAMVNLIAMTYALRGPLAVDASTQVEGHGAYDPNDVYFYGISQGHILGGTYVALSPFVERAVLGVGGASFTFMMSRAEPFSTFLQLLRVGISDPLDLQKFIALVSPTLDRIDPITYAPHVLADPYPDGPQHRRLLLLDGLGDTQVPNLATHLHARALGLPLLQPGPRTLVGLDPVEVPPEGADISALMEVDFGIDPDPTRQSRIPEDGTCVHEALRRLDFVQDMTDRFWRPDGVVTQPCGGVCRATCP